MKITIDGRALEWYQSTGMGTYSLNLAEGLKKANNHQYSFGFSEKQFDATPWGHMGDTPNFWERVYENPLTLKEKCDVFHNPFNGFGLAMNRDYPGVITLHDVIPLIMPKHCGSPYKEHFQDKISEITESADHIIAVSRRTKEDVIEHLKIPPKKISVIYQGVEPIFRPLNTEIVNGYLKENYEITKDFCLYVGGFSPRKNLNTLIKAFALIQDEIPWDLVVVGREGKTSSQIIKLVETLHLERRVRFIGFVPRADLPYFYNGAKVFVFPSLYEGFGLPPLEAASCGTAVLTSSGGSLPEILENHALYFNPQKSEEIAIELRNLFQHKEDTIVLAREGFGRSREFSPLIAARKTLGIYESLCR